MWYHFAFVSISLALFGLSIGALIVYKKKEWFQNSRSHLSRISYYYAWAIILSLFVILSIPLALHISLTAIFSGFLRYMIIATVFTFSGMIICLILASNPMKAGMLYAIDLAGSAIACLLVIPILSYLDAPAAIAILSALAAIASWIFAEDGDAKYKKRSRNLLISVFLLVFLHLVSARYNYPLISIVWSKNGIEPKPVYEKWTPFARLLVYGEPEKPVNPVGWGMSSKTPREYKIPQIMLFIDNLAGTVITKWNGKNEEIEFLKYDITNIAHYIRKNADVLVVGIGGGRDLLSAIAFNQKHVTGLEFNGKIIELLKYPFAEYSGNLYKHHKVTMIDDEARSFIARSKQKYDLIQISQIDTWAATAAGAYVLTENSLYTVEAWSLFISRLNEKGILTVSRWYLDDKPYEIYRLVTLARSSLKNITEKASDHIILIRNNQAYGLLNGMGTIMVARSPFDAGELREIRSICNELNFEIMLIPGEPSKDRILQRIIETGNLQEEIKKYPYDISPNTDDNPFFFLFYRLSDVFKLDPSHPVFTLVSLLFTVILLGLLCIVIPWKWDRMIPSGSPKYMIYFASIGLAYMLIEISQMQRLVIFLGHPVYSLTVVLFSLLVSSGIGSYISGIVSERYGMRKTAFFWIFLVLLVILFGYLTPYIISSFSSTRNLVRIPVAFSMLFIIGFFMGMPFPMGFKLASTQHGNLPLAWFWGINGAMSVIASVMAICISVSYGIGYSFWLGALFYIAAGILFYMLIKDS